MRAFLLVFLVVPLIDFAAVAAEPAPSSPAALDARKIATLLGQLDDEEFTVREQATQAMIALGAAVKPQVTAALKSASPEVRSRAAIILNQIADNARELIQKERMAALEKELEVFLKEPDGKFRLPGWEIFQRVVTDTPSSRQYFANALKEHGAWLIELEEREADQWSYFESILKQRMQSQEVGEEIPSAERDRMFSMICLGSQMLRPLGRGKSAEPKPEDYDETFVTVLQSEICSVEQVSEPAAKFFFHWLEGMEDEENRDNTIEMVAGIPWGKKSHDLAIAQLKKYAEDRKLAVSARARALFAFANMSPKSPTSRTWLETFLTDESPVGSFEFAKSKCDTQFRDLALVTLVQFYAPNKGKKFKEFGFEFEVVGQNRHEFAEAAALGFKTNEARLAALKKWKDVPQTPATTPAKKKR